LVDEYLEFEKLEMSNAEKRELPVTSEFRIYERLKPLKKKEECYNVVSKKDGDNRKPFCCKDKSLREVMPPNKVRRPDKIKFDKSDIDKVHYILNDYLLKDMQAKKNWRKVKFRLQVISQFQSLKEWILEPPDSESDIEDEKKKKLLWYIIPADSLTKVCWDMFTNMVYVINFFMILYTIGFDRKPLE